LGVYNIWIMNIFPTVILQDFYREVSSISKSQLSQYVFTKDLYNILQKKYLYFVHRISSFRDNYFYFNNFLIGSNSIFDQGSIS
jgi:hypothetical protein